MWIDMILAGFQEQFVPGKSWEIGKIICQRVLWRNCQKKHSRRKPHEHIAPFGPLDEASLPCPSCSTCKFCLPSPRLCMLHPLQTFRPDSSQSVVKVSFTSEISHAGIIIWWFQHNDSGFFSTPHLYLLIHLHCPFTAILREITLNIWFNMVHTMHHRPTLIVLQSFGGN